MRLANAVGLRGSDGQAGDGAALSEGAGAVWCWSNRERRRGIAALQTIRPPSSAGGFFYERPTRHGSRSLAPEKATPRRSPVIMQFNAAGMPAISLPLHWSGEGLPIGVRFGGRHGDDATLLRLAAQLEAAAPWFERRPPLT